MTQDKPRQKAIAETFMCTLECGGIKRSPIEKVNIFYPQMVHLLVLYFCLRSRDRLCMKMQCFKCMSLTCLCCFGNWTALKFWQNGAVCCDLCGNFLILIGRWCWCCKTVKGFLLLLLDSWCSPQQQRWTLTNNQDGSSFLHSCHLRRFHHLLNFCRF